MLHKIVQILTDPTGEVARLKAERNFLADRLSSWSHFNDSVGLSANAMLRQAIFNQESPEGFPRDSSDLARCERTYRAAPKHLQKKMLPTLIQFRNEVNNAAK